MLQNNSMLAQLKQQIRDTTPRVEGVIKATDKGFGFLETDDGDSYFVPPPAMKQVLHGDRVKAILKEEGDKTSVEPDTLLEIGLQRFVARVQKREGRLAVVPDHPSVKNVLKARLKRSLDEDSIEDGDWVVARLVRHPLKEGDRGFFSQIDELVAKSDNPAVPWRVTLARHALEQASPEAGDDWPMADEGLTREDLTAEPFFTIDGEKTRDMDDALRVETLDDGGWRLTVAIADPTAYVDESHAADQEARTRAFTVYLPGQNVTMLPEVLADDLCSLWEGKERPVLACALDIDAEGNLGDYRFFAANMTSKSRLVYDHVSDWIEGQGDWAPDDAIAPQLTALRDLTEARSAWRAAHALVFKDRPDYVFDLDDAGNVLDIRTEDRRIANRMIEESMIAANACCADLLADKVGHGIFNVHRAFEPEKADAAHEFLAAQDIQVEREALLELPRYRELKRELESRDDAWLDVRLRRFQGFTSMSALPGPHFGLGLAAYATWTSPIRKYGDMVNHRLIKRVLKGESAPAEASQALTEQLTERRRLNRMAERDVKDWLYVRYLAEAAKEQQEFEAEIIAVNRGGMRVRLVDNGATAFIPAPLMHSERDKVVIDDKEGRIQIEGEERFKLGDMTRVALTEAREETRSLVARPAV
ncbi:MULTISPECIES: exoribonuclease II [Halomonadaceae]|jgi:exoribonuclease-2|uniref:exoribonuclease II n=1 Tax=Halomonadaceae TaxID=28256 RepID=UPI001582F6E8|nr:MULTISPECIES: exoribonuclease II [Halomonas]MDI4636618.1 exoribonuclease II [Halomonas sp. BMC7]NUJ60983.1 exoribonuclease II [Halomonas taeanensis]|tara:strand:- start:4726 stop:6666 length:1941 start_codon:yes stop_codon:yes gene_type:complete